MKTKLALLIIPILFLSACSTTYYSSIPYDDVYYNGPARITEDQVNNADYKEVEVYEGEYDPEYAEEETVQNKIDHPVYYNDFDFYYNYLFSSRLRRFHRPYYSFGYYNDYFTNMYWYELNPYLWGTSIYLNSNWMFPYYGWSGNFYSDIYWGMGGFNMGWPYYYSAYPYYYGGWPYYGYNYFGFGFGYYPSYYGYYHGSGYYSSSIYRGDNHRPTLGRVTNRPNYNNGLYGDARQNNVSQRRDRNAATNNQMSTKSTRSFSNNSLSVGTPETGRSRSNTTITNGSAGGTFTNSPYGRLNNSSAVSGSQQRTVSQERKTYTKPVTNSNLKSLNSRETNVQNSNVIRKYQKPVQQFSSPNTYNAPNTRSSTLRQLNTNKSIESSGTNINRTPTNNRSNNVINSIRRVITSPARSNNSYSAPVRSSSRSVSTPIRSSSGSRGSSVISTGSRSSSSGTVRSSSSSSGSGSSSSGSGSRKR